MNENRVLVLMSTYNGIKYIEQQIDSIFKQKDVEVNLLIRDDGSLDGTKEYLLSIDDDRINVICGSNVGFASSFMQLVYEASKFDYPYYAFSDQDDVWLPDKLFTAISMLKTIERQDVPNLYYSNFTLVDEHLNPFFPQKNTILPADPYIYDTESLKPQLLVRYFMLGCTMVFNKKTVDFVTQYKPVRKIEMHDMWLGQTCGFFGHVVYDCNSHFLYRQHGKNAAGVDNSMRGRFRRLVKSFKTYERRHFRELGAKIFLDTYKDILSEKDRDLVSIVADYKKSLRNRIRFLFSRKIKMGVFSSDLMIKLRVIFGIA